jgi:uncharacterized membrane protein
MLSVFIIKNYELLITVQRYEKNGTHENISASFARFLAIVRAFFVIAAKCAPPAMGFQSFESATPPSLSVVDDKSRFSTFRIDDLQGSGKETMSSDFVTL